MTLDQSQSLRLSIWLTHGYASSAAAIWQTWGSILHCSAHWLHVITCLPTKSFILIWNWTIYSWNWIWTSWSELFDWLLVPLIENPGERKKTLRSCQIYYLVPEVFFKWYANGNSFEVDTWPTGAILYTPVIDHPPCSSTCSCSYTRSTPCSFQTNRIRRLWLNFNDSLRCQGCQTIFSRPQSLYLKNEFHRKLMDHCKKYEMGYALTDGSVGVHFNDSTRLVLKCESHAIPFGGDDMRMALRQWRPLGPRKMALRWKNENEWLTRTIWWFDGDDIDLIFCSPDSIKAMLGLPPYGSWKDERWRNNEHVGWPQLWQSWLYSWCLVSFSFSFSHVWPSF